MMGVNDRERDVKEAQTAARRVKAAKQAEWRGYINADMSDGVKAQFEDWLKGEGPWVHLRDIVDAGCVVSLKLDGSNSRYLCSVTQRNPESVNAGLCVTARGSTVEKALFRAVFTVAWLGVLDDWAAAGRLASDDSW